MSNDFLICDADSVAFKAAAANEKRKIRTVHIEKGIPETWDHRTAFRTYLSTTNHTEDMYTIEDIQEPKHLDFGKKLVREMLQGYSQRTGITARKIYISGDDNFRDLIPLPAEYKPTINKRAGTDPVWAGAYKNKREGNIRPVQLKELRAYMQNDLGAIPVHGMEVDDMSSILAWDGFRGGWKAVQVTEDKDAAQCSGWLFNPAKDKAPRFIQGFGELHREIKKGKEADVKGTGRIWLYFQALYGDDVDCYHGCDLWKIQQDKAGKKITFGEVAAYNLLKDCKTDKEALQVVHDQYFAWYPETQVYVDCFGVVQSKDHIEMMQMYFDCAHMRRWKDDRIDVKAMLTKMRVI